MTQHRALLALTLLALATLAGAFYFEYGMGLIPCPLCLQQRYAYYFVAGFGLFMLLLQKPRFIKLTLKLFAVVFLLNMWLALYHTGAELQYWQGPSTCGGNGASMNGVTDLLKSIATAKVVSCTEVQWRLFGISLAGYNVLISAFAAALAFVGSKQKQ